jgi:hypothetical protein
MLTVVAENGSMRDGVSLLDDVVREGARRMWSPYGFQHTLDEHGGCHPRPEDIFESTTRRIRARFGNNTRSDATNDRASKSAAAE